MAPPDKTPQHEDPDASLEVLIERQRTLFEIEDQRLRNIDAHAIVLTASGLAALALAGAKNTTTSAVKLTQPKMLVSYGEGSGQSYS